jgi:hypothetical protein
MREQARRHSAISATSKSASARTCRFLVTTAASFFRNSEPVSVTDVNTITPPRHPPPAAPGRSRRKPAQGRSQAPLFPAATFRRREKTCASITVGFRHRGVVRAQGSPHLIDEKSPHP